jgi:hypothetical protein
MTTPSVNELRRLSAHGGTLLAQGRSAQGISAGTQKRATEPPARNGEHARYGGERR